MRTYKYINDRQLLLAQGKEIVSESADNKYVHRVSMVNLILGGMNPKDLAEYCGDSVRTLQTWVRKVDEKGWHTLVAIKNEGRPSRLSESQIEAIRDTVKEDPVKIGYDVWDGPSLSQYIEENFGVQYGVRACQKLLHRMGFALIRPQTYPSLENPDNERREDFKKNYRKCKKHQG